MLSSEIKLQTKNNQSFQAYLYSMSPTIKSFIFYSILFKQVESK